MRHTQDGEVWQNNVKCRRDICILIGLYFLWHDINLCITPPPFVWGTNLCLSHHRLGTLPLSSAWFRIVLKDAFIQVPGRRGTVTTEQPQHDHHIETPYIGHHTSKRCWPTMYAWNFTPNLSLLLVQRIERPTTHTKFNTF